MVTNTLTYVGCSLHYFASTHEKKEECELYLTMPAKNIEVLFLIALQLITSNKMKSISSYCMACATRYCYCCEEHMLNYFRFISKSFADTCVPYQKIHFFFENEEVHTHSGTIVIYVSFKSTRVYLWHVLSFYITNYIFLLQNIINFSDFIFTVSRLR